MEFTDQPLEKRKKVEKEREGEEKGGTKTERTGLTLRGQ